MIAYITNLSEVRSIDACARAVVFFCVEWSAPERKSRIVFAEFARLIPICYQSVSLFYLPEQCEGAIEWVTEQRLSEVAGGGWGGVAWLENGRVIAVEMNAARRGADELVKQTELLWGMG